MINLSQQNGSNHQIKPSCSGKLLSNNYNINVRLNHDIGSCCPTGIGSSIPIVFLLIFRLYFR